jgi:ADP-heptose:LPS heptosyltransferase
MPRVRRIVILRPLGLGDFLTGIPAYRAVARAFPAHRITLAASPAYQPLLDLAGAIDDICATEPLAPLAPELHGADVAVDLHGRGPASQRVLLAARPRRVISFRNDAVPETRSGAPWIADEHEVVRWCRMLDHAGIPADPGDLDLRAAPGRFAPRTHAMTIVHASAASESRRWPVERWAAVARAETLAGRIVALTGSAGERERVETIADLAAIPRAQVFAGRTNLRQLAALVASAGRVVCGDTGVGHLATALRTPSVLLFGPTPPALWGPPPGRVYHRVLWSGRRGDPHGASVDPGLLRLTVDAVLAELAALDRTLPIAV